VKSAKPDEVESNFRLQEATQVETGLCWQAVCANQGAKPDVRHPSRGGHLERLALCPETAGVLGAIADRRKNLCSRGSSSYRSVVGP